MKLNIEDTKDNIKDIDIEKEEDSEKEDNKIEIKDTRENRDKIKSICDCL